MSLNEGDKQSRRVMVTGASGFIGGRVARELAQSGAEVFAVVRSRQHGDCRSMLASSHHITVVECDLLDPAAVATLIEAHRPNSYVHCAWDVAGANYLHDTANQRWVQATLNLARELIDNGCRWLGVCGTHIEASGTNAPPNRYAAAKATLRHRLFEIARGHFPICWWKIFQPYGEGERTDRFIPSMLATLATGERFLVRQPAALRDFVHVNDVAGAIFASHQREIGGVFEVGGGQLRQLRDVARTAARMLTSEHLLDFAPVAPTHDERSVPADIAPLEALTGWRPRIDIERGLSELAQQWTTPLRATA